MVVIAAAVGDITVRVTSAARDFIIKGLIASIHA